MKSKKSSLRAALFLALVGAAFLFTACWQGTPAGGDKLPDVTENGGKTSDGNKSGDTDSKDSDGKNSGEDSTASSIEGSWKANSGQLVLQLKNGKVTYTSTVGVEVSDSGTYTITGTTITFTGFTNPGVKVLFNREFKYEIKGDTLTLLDGATNTPMFKFKKA